MQKFHLIFFMCLIWASSVLAGTKQGFSGKFSLFAVGGADWEMVIKTEGVYKKGLIPLIRYKFENMLCNPSCSVLYCRKAHTRKETVCFHNENRVFVDSCTCRTKQDKWLQIKRHLANLLAKYQKPQESSSLVLKCSVKSESISTAFIDGDAAWDIVFESLNSLNEEVLEDLDQKFLDLFSLELVQNG